MRQVPLIKRRNVLLQRVKMRPQVVQYLIRITSLDLPGINETRPIIAVVADQQCAKAHARPLWIGEPTDDEFLPTDALNLHPPGATPVDVWTVQMLANDAFTPLMTRLPP